MFSIRPKYTKRTICHYCGENEATKGEEAVVFFHKVLAVHNDDCSVLNIELRIPRCKGCSNKQTKASGSFGRYFLFYFLILIPFCLFYWHYNGFDSWVDVKEDFFGAVVGLLMGVFLVAFFGAFLLMWIYGKILELIQSGKRKPYDNVKSYGPADKLLKCGFTQGFVDKKYEIAIFKEYDGEAFKTNLLRTLQEIEKEDDCSVTEREYL